MVECESCKEWYHEDCIDEPSAIWQTKHHGYVILVSVYSNCNITHNFATLVPITMAMITGS